MTIQEIRDLITKKIAGQGTQVDVGGGLPTILNEILNVLSALPTPPQRRRVVVSSEEEFGDAIEVDFVPELGGIVDFYVNETLYYTGEIVTVSSRLGSSQNGYVVLGGDDGASATPIAIYYTLN